MTVRIVETRTFTILCYDCRSIIEYQYSDLTEARWSDYSGDSGNWKYVTCPVCNTKVEHK